MSAYQKLLQEFFDKINAKQEELGSWIATQASVISDLESDLARMKTEDDIVKQCLSRILFNQSFGGSLANYCEERGWIGITVYVEEKYWCLTEPVFVSFMEKHKPLVKQWIADKDFLYQTSGNYCYGEFKPKVLSNQKFSQKDIIFILKPTYDKNIVNKFVQIGAIKENIFELPNLLNQTRRYFIYEKPLINIKAKYPNVQIAFVKLFFATFPKDNLTENEKNIIEKDIFHSKKTREELRNNKKRISFAWDEFGYSDEDILEVLTHTPSYYNENGVLVFKDVRGKLVNTLNGNRITTDVPKNAKRRIYILGQCVTFGFGSPDEWTMQSWLQRMLNEAIPEEKFEVVNLGRYLGGIGLHTIFINILDNIPVQDNDIIFVNYFNWEWEYDSKPIVLQAPVVDLQDCFKKPYPYGDVWIDKGHYGPHGQHMVADALFAFLQEHDFFRNGDRSPPPETILLYLLGCHRHYLVYRSLRWRVSRGNMRCRNKFGMTVVGVGMTVVGVGITVVGVGMTVSVVSMQRSLPSIRRCCEKRGMR